MNRFILADAEKCIGCRTCEVACVVSHQQDQDCSGVSAARFAPRIRVVKNDELSTATSVKMRPAPTSAPRAQSAAKTRSGTWISAAVSDAKAVWWRVPMAR